MHPAPRPYTLVVLCLSLAFLSGCASESSIKPAESLDERMANFERELDDHLRVADIKVSVAEIVEP